MPDLGVLLVVWRMAPDLLGQIRRCLVVFLLTAVLSRTEPEAEGRDAAGDSINKALVGSLVSDMGDGAISSPGRGGSEGRRKKADDACSAAGLCWGWCSSSWSSPSATQDWSLNLIAVRRLLRMPTVRHLMCNLHVRRPFYGATAVVTVFYVPGGFVPGDEEDDRRWFPVKGDGGVGLDCFFNLSSRVFSVKAEVCSVIASFPRGLSVKCTVTADNECTG